MSTTPNTRKKLRFKHVQPYLFISPFFIMYAILGVYPLVSGFGTAMKQGDSFVGLANFRWVLQDERFGIAIKNVLMYTAGSVFIILPMALCAALILCSPKLSRIRGTVSTIFFTPNVTSVITIGIVFNLLLKTNNGTINALLKTLGLIERDMRWLSDPKLALPSLLILCTWRYFGSNSLYFLSGLQSVPKELCEAARIDGCNPLKELIYIRLPMIKPITTYLVFTAIVGSFGISGEVYTLVGVGGTGARNSMLYPAVYLYNTMLRDGKMNEASAMGYVLAVILIILTSIQRYVFSDKNERRARKVV